MPKPLLAPSVLLLDDGELDTVDRTLRRLGADRLRLTGAQISGRIEQPRDLLITSGKRTLDMPELESLEGAEAPVWISVHNQDFLPLRQRMRGLGVNFLVHSSLDLESLRLFLVQMLYRGSERRVSRRLPLGVDVSLLADKIEKTVRLIEVSAASCRILSPQPITIDSGVVLLLPKAIGGGDRCELRGTAVRSSLCQTRGGDIAYGVVLRFDDLQAEARAALDKLLRGEQISAPVSPLAGADAAVTEADGGDEHAGAEARERRVTNRSVYERRVDLLEPRDSCAEGSGLGRDLSLDGVRVRGYSEIEPGTCVTLALYGGRREEPVLVKSSVVRGYGADEVAFRFDDLSPEQARGIEKLAVGLGRLESIEDGGPVVVTKLVDDA